MKEKFLLHSSQANQVINEKVVPLYSKKSNWAWSDRLILIEDKHSIKSWNFNAFDLLMNESRLICFPKSNKSYCCLNDVYPLNEEFGFIIERLSCHSRINFVKFDWGLNKFQRVDYFEHTSYFPSVIVDKLNPSKFVLEWSDDDDININNYQCCKLVNEKIKFGEIYQFITEFNHYSNNKLITTNNSFTDTNKIVVYDLILKKEHTVDMTQSFHQNVSLYHFSSFEWVNDRLYASFYLHGTGNDGVMWTDLTTKQWHLLDFESDFNIHELQFFNGSLIVTSKDKIMVGDNYERVQKLYSVPVKKPHFLRYSAWLSVVHVMKKNGEKDPYKAAKEFLPLNSDLQAPWFEDKEQKEA